MLSYSATENYDFRPAVTAFTASRLIPSLPAACHTRSGSPSGSAAASNSSSARRLVRNFPTWRKRLHLAIPSTKEAITFDLRICASEVLEGDRPLRPTCRLVRRAIEFASATRFMRER